MALLPSSSTFTLERLRKVWAAHQPVPGLHQRHRYEDFTHDENHKFKFPRKVKKFCLELYASVQEPENHLSELDRRFVAMNTTPFFRTKLSEGDVSSFP